MYPNLACCLLANFLFRARVASRSWQTTLCFADINDDGNNQSTWLLEYFTLLYFTLHQFNYQLQICSPGLNSSNSLVRQQPSLFSPSFHLQLHSTTTSNLNRLRSANANPVSQLRRSSVSTNSLTFPFRPQFIIMFRRLSGGLPKDPVFPADLKGLG